MHSGKFEKEVLFVYGTDQECLAYPFTLYSSKSVKNFKFLTSMIVTFSVIKKLYFYQA